MQPMKLNDALSIRKRARRPPLLRSRIEMSKTGVEDSPSIQQILAEDSIFELTKKLSEGISGRLSNKKKNNMRHVDCVKKKNHFQVYEALLTGRSTEEDGKDLDFRIVSSANRLNLQDDDVRELSQRLQQLSGNPNGEKILRFLLGLADTQPRAHTNQPRTKKGVLFYCPPEMLDGTLFEQRPTHQSLDEDYQLKMEQFDALPGSYLPLAQRFFNLYGVPVTAPAQINPPALINDQDQGYSSPPLSEYDWDAVARMEPLPRYRTWESLGHLEPWREKPLLSEAGVLGRVQERTNVVTMQQLQRDLTFLLVGVTSSCFPFSEEHQKFEVAEGLSVVGLTFRSLQEVVAPLLECGRYHRQLELYTETVCNDRGLIVKALKRAVGRFLVLHREASQRIVARGGAGFLKLLRDMSWLAPPLAAVAAICCQPQAPLGTAALEQLCRYAAVLPPGRTACVLFSLLKSAAEAYFRLLGRWLFEGEIDEDGASEFLVLLQPGMLGLRTRRYWTQGFVLLEARVPSFLLGLEDSVMMCGKAMRFLKLCNPKDPLVSELQGERPTFECCLQPSELVSLQGQCQAYEQKVREACGPPVTAAAQLERTKEEQAAFLEMVQQVQQERIREIRASQQAVREAKQAGKRRLLSEWQQQMEESQQRRAAILHREKAEEQQRQKVLDEQYARDDLRLAHEREKVISHYEALSQAADERLARSEKKIERLKEELGQKGSGEQTSDINSNPLDGLDVKTDDNANAPSPVQVPRNVPTSLPLNTEHHLEDMKNANQQVENTPHGEEPPIQDVEISKPFTTTEIYTSEAARNKARVLQHEYNLITNYNDNVNIANVIQDKDDQVPQPTVTEIYNLGNSEAVRNKARVLQHDFNNDKVSPVHKSNIINQELDLAQENTKTEEAKEMKINVAEIYNCGNREAVRNRARVLQQEWSYPARDSKVSESSTNSESVPTPSTPCSGDGFLPTENDKDFPCSTMSMSIESAPSMVTEAETPTGVFPSAMSISFETSSCGNLLSPSSAMTSSAVTDSKETPSSDVPRKIPKSVSNISFISALSVLSEPLKWQMNKNKDDINSTVKKLDISTSHLSHLLRETVAVVLTMQVKLVNQSVLKLFLQDEQLFGHFRSLRQYFLLVDGEFARQITEKLCHGIKENAKNPRSLLNFVSLDGILRHALSCSVHGSKDSNADRLSLGMRFEPSSFQVREVKTLECVQLQYQVAWPLCLVLTPDALLQYDRLFSFLLGLRRGVLATDEAFQWLQRPPLVDRKLLAGSTHYHQLRLFRHEMGSFMQALHSYFMNFAVLESWKNCKKGLKKATTLDELYRGHTTFVKQVIFYCLLRKEAASAQELVQSVLRSVLKFHCQLTSRDWVLRDGVYEHQAFDQLTTTFTQFKMRTSVLLKHMTKVAKRGYQPILYELLHLLNMNDYYNIQMSSP